MITLLSAHPARHVASIWYTPLHIQHCVPPASSARPSFRAHHRGSASKACRYASKTSNRAVYHRSSRCSACDKWMQLDAHGLFMFASYFVSQHSTLQYSTWIKSVNTDSRRTFDQSLPASLAPLKFHEGTLDSNSSYRAKIVQMLRCFMNSVYFFHLFSVSTKKTFQMSLWAHTSTCRPHFLTTSSSIFIILLCPTSPLVPPPLGKVKPKETSRVNSSRRVKYGLE